MSIELPPPPPRVDDALTLANAIAYGFTKHTDPAYWEQGVGYRGDPVYFWKRLLGWQAEGGPDQAKYGLYAVPPSPWNVAGPAPVPVPVPPVVVPPVESPADLNARLDSVIAALRVCGVRLEAIETALNRPPPTVTFPAYSGRVLGIGVTLKPDKGV